jgi:hypothetical protein
MLYIQQAVCRYVDLMSGVQQCVEKIELCDLNDKKIRMDQDGTQNCNNCVDFQCDSDNEEPESNSR